MPIKFIYIFILLALPSCVNSKKADMLVKEAYIGKTLDNFVIDNSPPIKSFELSEGGAVYIWSSGVINYNIPSPAIQSGRVDSFGNYHGTSTPTGGSSINVECQLKIITDKNNIITSMAVFKDTWGNWELSRCHEYFKRKHS